MPYLFQEVEKYETQQPHKLPMPIQRVTLDDKQNFKIF